MLAPKNEPENAQHAKCTTLQSMFSGWYDSNCPIHYLLCKKSKDFKCTLTSHFIWFHYSLMQRSNDYGYTTKCNVWEDIAFSCAIKVKMSCWSSNWTLELGRKVIYGALSMAWLFVPDRHVCVIQKKVISRIYREWFKKKKYRAIGRKMSCGCQRWEEDGQTSLNW